MNLKGKLHTAKNHESIKLSARVIYQKNYEISTGRALSNMLTT